MDRFSDKLIKKIRKQTSSSASGSFVKNEDTKAEPVLSAKTETDNADQKKDRAIELKKEEQRLILEISKNPKSPSLYEELGDLYMEAGSYKDAKESYEAAIELNAKDEKLKEKLSDAFARDNESSSDKTKATK